MSGSTTPTTWTIRSLLTWTADFLHKKGIEAAQRETRLLLAHVLGCQPIEVIARYDEEASDTHRAQFRELIHRRVAGWPVAYLIGRREFYLLTFEVSPAVLIPRPDTETLVMEAIRQLKNRPKPRVLDLGTGSGCIAISIANQCKDASVLAVDISPDAAEVAMRNIEKHELQDRVQVKIGDLFQAVPSEPLFDLIVSNPPYIPPTEIAQLSVEVRDHEPRLALDGGPDGLAYYRRIANVAAAFLKPDGVLLLEIGHTQQAAVEEILQNRPEWVVRNALKDMAGRPRVVVASIR